LWCFGSLAFFPSSFQPPLRVSPLVSHFLPKNRGVWIPLPPPVPPSLTVFSPSLCTSPVLPFSISSVSVPVRCYFLSHPWRHTHPLFRLPGCAGPAPPLSLSLTLSLLSVFLLPRSVGAISPASPRPSNVWFPLLAFHGFSLFFPYLSLNHALSFSVILPFSS